MYTFTKTFLLLATLLLLAANSWALPFADGDSVTMSASGFNYTLTHNDIAYDAFCVEKNEFFYDNGTYEIESVGNIAYGGGIGGVVSSSGGDPISTASIWLYASFFGGDFGDITGSKAVKVQNAIWYAEEEISNNDDYNYFLDYAGILTSTGRDSDLFSVSGWDIQVVNLVDADGTPRQSQLVGTAPVPEPSTLLLLGAGLGGLALYRRKAKK